MQILNYSEKYLPDKQHAVEVVKTKTKNETLLNSENCVKFNKWFKSYHKCWLFIVENIEMKIHILYNRKYSFDYYEIRQKTEWLYHQHANTSYIYVVCYMREHNNNNAIVSFKIVGGLGLLFLFSRSTFRWENFIVDMEKHKIEHLFFMALQLICFWMI